MKMKVGMAEMLYSWAASSFSSTSTFKNTTSAISLDIASICGAITLHGPHLELTKQNNDNDTFRENFQYLKFIIKLVNDQYFNFINTYQVA